MHELESGFVPHMPPPPPAPEPEHEGGFSNNHISHSSPSSSSSSSSSSHARHREQREPERMEHHHHRHHNSDEEKKAAASSDSLVAQLQPKHEALTQPQQQLIPLTPMDATQGQPTQQERDLLRVVKEEALRPNAWPMILNWIVCVFTKLFPLFLVPIWLRLQNQHQKEM